MRKTIGGGRAVLYQDDCLDRLRRMRDDSVDIVVTSPPYNQLRSVTTTKGTGLLRNSGWIKKVKATCYHDSLPEGLYQRWLAYVVAECLRVARGLVWINHKVRYRDRVAVHPLSFLNFPVYSEVVWSRPGSIVANARKYMPSHEYLFGFGKPHYWDKAIDGKLSVWRINPTQGIPHPCPYPEEIASRPIQSSCPEGGIVLDPFAGSGTTGMAAVKLGRRFIGIEKHKRFVDLATQRIREVMK